MSKRRRPGAVRRVAQEKFWGQAEQAPAAVSAIRPTPDPGTLIRSLGPAPLAVDPTRAERHLEAVYEEAVRTATALAAANGLLDQDVDQ